MLFNKHTLPTLASAVLRKVKRLIHGDRMLASPEKLKARLDVCHKCDQLYDKQCKVCTCYVDVKAMWEDEVCPILKW
jgi:hypothetical protein